MLRTRFPPRPGPSSFEAAHGAPLSVRRLLQTMLCGAMVGLGADTQALAAETTPTTGDVSQVAVGVVDTAGIGYLIVRPTIEYQWIATAAPASVPRVHRVRSAQLVFEEEITSELRPFNWDEIRRIQPAMAADGAARTRVMLGNGQEYTCLVGYTRAGRVPPVIGQSNGTNPGHVTRTIKATRMREGRLVAVEIPWGAVSSLDVFPLTDESVAAIKHLEGLVQERARLSARIQAIDIELEQLIKGPSGP